MVIKFVKMSSTKTENDDKKEEGKEKIRLEEIHEIAERDGKPINTSLSARSKCVSAAPISSSHRKKRTLHPLMASIRNPYQSQHYGTRLDLNVAAHDNLSSFTQRVMSAKLLRLKQLQNQLSEAHLQINELCTENRLLRALQKRQDLALDRYEGTQAQLPQLVRSHHEEVRVLRSKYKSLKLQLRDTSKILKEREMELQNLKEQHAHLLKLSRDRHLGERDSLNKQVEELKLVANNQTNTIQMLNRKIVLESKNLKCQLQQEMSKHKSTQMELRDALTKLEQLQMQIEVKEKHSIPTFLKRPGRIGTLNPEIPEIKVPGYTKEDKTAAASEVKETSQENGNGNLSSESLSQNITDQSSDQPDFSAGISYSYTTSTDSSPDHNADEDKAVSLSELKITGVKVNDARISEIFLTDLQTNNNNIEKHFDTAEYNVERGLSTNYKTNEVSNSTASPLKYYGSSEDIGKALAAIDLASTKHKAALANASYAVKSATSALPQPIPKRNLKNASAFSNRKKIGDLSFHDKLNIPKKSSPIKLVKIKSQNSFEKKDVLHHSSLAGGDSISAITKSKVVENGKESTSNAKIPPHFEDGKQRPKLSGLLKFEQFESFDNRTQTQDNDDEGFQKEALLKALKAIDDDRAARAGEGSESESDNDSSNVIKITTRGAAMSVLPSVPTNINFIRTFDS